MTLALVGCGIAILGVVSGLAWKIPSIGHLDRTLFRFANGVSLPAWADAVLRAVRPLGTSWALLAAAAAISIWRPLSGISLLGVGLLSGAVERAIKITVRRMRPFDDDPGVQVRLLPLPRDPSFPSGDASRAWYFAGAAVAALPALWPLGSAACALATLVSFSRVRGGVHFPADVWAGSWLGLGMGLVWAWVDASIRARFG